MFNLTETQQVAMQAAIDKYTATCRAAMADYVQAANEYYATPETAGLDYVHEQLPRGYYGEAALATYIQALCVKNLASAQNALDDRQRAAAMSLHVTISRILRGDDND